MLSSKPFTSLDSRNSLDKGLVVVSSKRWVLLLALVGIGIAASLWAVFAEVPIIVEGPGILLHETGVSQVENFLPGEIEEIRVVRGASVRAGDILAMVRSPSTVAEIETSKLKLRSLEEMHAKAVENEERQHAIEKKILDARSESLRDSISSLESAIAKWNEAETSESSTSDDAGFAAIEQDAKNLLEKLRSQNQSIRDLATANLATISEVNKSENAVLSSLQSLFQLRDQQIYKNRQRLQFRQGLIELQGKLQEWQYALDTIDLQWNKILGQSRLERFRREVEIEAQKSMLDRLSQEYERYRFIRSQHDGVVLELPYSLGDPVQPGQTIASLARTPPDESSDRLRVTAFFPITTGKKILQRASAFVSPSVAEVHRYGSIRGMVDDVYGYPMSSSEAYRLVGNREMLTPFLNQGGVLGIHVRLHSADEDSQKLDWTVKNRAPDLTLGTIVKVKVVVERRSPISYLLPMMRHSIYGPDRIEDVIP